MPKNCKTGANGEFSITIAKTIDEVARIRPLWEGMQLHPNGDIDFYLMVLESRIEIIRPHVMVLHRAGDPEAMLIGRIEEKRVAFQIGYRTVLRAKARVLTIIYGGRLGKQSNAIDEAFAAELVGSLKQGEADMAFLSHLRVDSSMYHFASKAPGLLWRDHFPASQKHWKMSLANTASIVYQKLSDGARWQLNKLLKDYKDKVELVCFREPNSIDRMIHDIEGIASKTYQRALGVSFVDSSETRRRMDLASRRGWLRSYVLYVDGDPCAFWIGTRYGNTFYGDYMGYDPRLRKYSPGTFVFMKMVEQLCAEGIREIDFGFGDAFYKQRFGDESWEEACVYMFAPTARGARLSAVRVATAAVSQAAERILKRLESLQKVKRVWRDHLIGKSRDQGVYG